MLGPVQINVVYPKPEQMLTVRDSNFIFGSVGSGDAALRINGVAIPVWPNGAFMGWLAVPPDSAPRYELLAGNKLEMFGDPDDYDNGVGQVGVRILSWREVR